jgi:toxin YoeB
MRRIVFEASAFEDFASWASLDKKVHAKIVALLRDIQRSPFAGLGKPEPLRHELQGYWSRRITDEHRLVYKVTDAEVIVASCRYHYG